MIEEFLCDPHTEIFKLRIFILDVNYMQISHACVLPLQVHHRIQLACSSHQELA